MEDIFEANNGYNPDTGTIDYDPDNPPSDHRKFRTVGVARIGVELRLPTGDVVNVNPDDYIHDLVVEDIHHRVSTFSGRLLEVCGSSRYQRFMPRHYSPLGPHLCNYILPEMLIVDSSEPHQSMLHYVPIFQIIGIGTIESSAEMGVIVVGSGPQYQPLDQVINGAEDGAIIELLSGDYEMDLELKKSITIRARGKATLHGKITIGETGSDQDLEVKLDGLDLTDQAMVTVIHATKFTMHNCVVYDLRPEQPRTMPIALTESIPVYVNITKNTFKANNANCYNLIDVYAYLSEFSDISNNRFERDCCTHNCISLYGLERNGDISIDHNYCERSANMVRIGFRGEVNGRISLRENCYDETDDDLLYAGLVIVQPYGKQTTSMYMLDISVTDTINHSGSSQLIYIYSGKDDLKFDSSTFPKIYIDGYYTDVPYIEVWPDDRGTVIGYSVGANTALPNGGNNATDDSNDNANNTGDPGDNYAPPAGYDGNNPPTPGTVVFDDTGDSADGLF